MEENSGDLPSIVGILYTPHRMHAGVRVYVRL